MKKTGFISLFVIATIFSSCAIFQNSTKNLEKKIIGHWNYEQLIDVSLSENEQTQLDYEFKDILSKSFIEFNNDYTYTMEFNNENLEGNWSISKKGELILQNNNIFIIDEISINKLTLINRGETKKTDIKMLLKKAI